MNWAKLPAPPTYTYLLSTHLKITPWTWNAELSKSQCEGVQDVGVSEDTGIERSTGYKGAPRTRGSVALILFNTLSVICYMCLRVLSLEEVFNFLCVLEMSPIRSVCSAGSSRYARSDHTCLQDVLAILYLIRPVCKVGSWFSIILPICRSTRFSRSNPTCLSSLSTSRPISLSNVECSRNWRVLKIPSWY